MTPHANSAQLKRLLGKESTGESVRERGRVGTLCPRWCMDISSRGEIPGKAGEATSPSGAGTTARGGGSLRAEPEEGCIVGRRGLKADAPDRKSWCEHRDRDHRGCPRTGRPPLLQSVPSRTADRASKGPATLPDPWHNQSLFP